MENDNETCGVCSISYDADNRIPRVLINCGHTLCACCLIEILKSPQLRKCPYDNLEFKRPQKCLENFPVNFALLALLEGKNRNICKVHGEKLVMFCLQDEVKICYGCALFGEHKGHSLKMINDLKIQGMKTKRDLEESLMKFEKNQLEKEQAVDLLKVEFLSKIGNKFEEIKDLIRERECEFTEAAESLFERNEEKTIELLLKDEVEKALGEIYQGCQKEENLAVLDQDFSSMISSLQPQDVKQEALKFTIQGSKMMDCMELFFTNEAKSIKNFELKERIKQSCSENCGEMKQKPPVLFKTKTLFTVDICDMCLEIRAKNSNPVDLTIDLTEQDKIKKISIELDKSLSFYQGSVDFNFLYQILSRFNNYTSLTVSFAPKDLTDYRALELLNLLFCQIQRLTEIEISFERCEITNQPVSFFCTEILPKAISLRNLTLKLGLTLLSDISLFALAKSLSPLSRNLESFTLGAEHTAIADNGIEKILPVILGVKALDLGLKGALVTDKSLKVLGNKVMPCMKNLEKFMLNCSEAKITIEGVNAIFTGIPNGIKCLKLNLEKVNLSDEIVSLFEEKICPKLGLIEEVYLRLSRTDLEVKVSNLLGSVRKEAERIKEACELTKGDN